MSGRPLGIGGMDAAGMPLFLHGESEVTTITELQWYGVSECLPDDGINVLLFDAAASEPIWIGYHEDDKWYYADHSRAYPTQWSDLPEGPQQ